MTTLLEVREASFAYPDHAPCVRKFSTQIEAQRLVALVGPNGAGKSTVLAGLLGHVPRVAGEVLLREAPLDRLSHRDKARHMAWVPQELDVPATRKVMDLVLGGRYPHRSFFGGDEAGVTKATEALTATGISALKERPLGEISGGERQRALIARCLAQESEILLVDEPTSSLDLRLQIAIFEILADLASQGRAILVVTHDLNLAAQFADEVILLSDGEIAASGPPEAIIRPEVLVPVYGPQLHFGAAPVGRGAKDCPFVLPWRGTLLD